MGVQPSNFPGQEHLCPKDPRYIRRVSQAGYSPPEKGHNLHGRLKIKSTKELCFSGPKSSHLRRKRYSSDIIPPPLQYRSPLFNPPHYQTLPPTVGKIMLK